MGLISYCPYCKSLMIEEVDITGFFVVGFYCEYCDISVPVGIDCDI